MFAKLAREVAEMSMVNTFDTVRVIDMDDIDDHEGERVNQCRQF